MKRGLLALAAILALGACKGPKDTTVDRRRVDARLQRYSSLLFAMDTAGVASMFAADGEMVNPKQPPVHGRAAIQKFLSGFADYHILSNVDEATSTLIDGDTAEQLGTYHQKVRTPEGQLFDVAGRLEISWVRDASGEWSILQLATFPEK